MRGTSRAFAFLGTCACLASGCTKPATGYFAGAAQLSLDGAPLASQPSVGGGDPLPSLPPVGTVDGGITGGHFDLDTSHLTYPFSGGTTDHHVHEFDDIYKTTGADFFRLPDSAFQNIGEAITDPKHRFILIVSNAELSPGGVLEINGAKVGVLDYQKVIRSDFEAAHVPQVYTLGTPQTSGDLQLKSLSVNFAVDVIPKGGLIPTQTGCVRRNDPGANGEYRNGALLLQALDAASYQIDTVTNSAKISRGGLLWEATVFWHRPDGICYGNSKYVR
jgi:hypothetical protein